MSGPCKHIATDWSGWSECTASCEGGRRQRTKAVVLGSGNSCFIKDDIEEEVCNKEACPPPPCELFGTDWTDWSACSATCGRGTIHRSRKVIVGEDNDCVEEIKVEATVCHTRPCCLLEETEWTEWSLCSNPCGGGARLRSREVVKGIDTDCTKDTEVEKKPCNADPCCRLKGTEWTAWSLCSATCGNGAKFRTREVVKGIDGECTKDTEVESKLCSSQPCITPTLTPTTTTTAGNIVNVVKNYALN